MITGLDVDEALLVDDLDLGAVKPGTVRHFRLNLVATVTGDSAWIPVMVMKGRRSGPTLMVTAVIHGNELNGMPVVHRLFRSVNVDVLHGTILGIPIVNVPAFMANQRTFTDGHDLNRLMPGKTGGNCAEVYASRFVERALKHADFLIDLHTASFGRANSLYVRADMTQPITARMARLQHCQIIVHNTGADGTLRSAAGSRNINAITVEVGDPQRFQRGMIRGALDGIENVLADLAMLPDRRVDLDEEPVLCKRSYWIHSDATGVLEILVDLAAHVNKGTPIARVSSIFGKSIRHYGAPEAGVVIGKSTNPVNHHGSRVLHLGVIGQADGACATDRSLKLLAGL